MQNIAGHQLVGLQRHPGAVPQDADLGPDVGHPGDRDLGLVHEQHGERGRQQYDDCHDGSHKQVRVPVPQHVPRVMGRALEMILKGWWWDGGAAQGVFCGLPPR